MIQLDTRLPLGVQPFDLGAVQRNALAAMQQRAAEQEMDNRNALATAMQTYGQGVLSPDAGKRAASIAGLAAAGPAGFQTALPLMQQEQQRLRPMTAAEVAAAGFRPGTVAMVNGLGVPQILQQSDVRSPEAEAQALRLTIAGRQPPAPTILGPGQVAVGRDGRVIATGPARPTQSPFEASEGGTMQILSDLAPLVAAGTATPEQQRNYAIAAADFQRRGGQVFERVNPTTNAIERVLVPGPLPAGFPAPVPFSQPAPTPNAADPGTRGPTTIAPPQPGAPMPPAAPPPQPAAPVSAAPTDPNAPRVLSSSPPRVNNEPMGADAAARVALVREGTRAVLDLENRIISDRGIDRNLLAGMWAGVPVGESAQYLNLVANAIGNRLRIETGAVIGRDEEINMARRYLPRPWDSPELVRQKLAGLRTYFTDFEQLTSPGGRNMPPASQAAPGTQPNAAPAGAGPPAVPRIVINPRGEIVR